MRQLVIQRTEAGAPPTYVANLRDDESNGWAFTPHKKHARKFATVGDASEFIVGYQLHTVGARIVEYVQEDVLVVPRSAVDAVAGRAMGLLAGPRASAALRSMLSLASHQDRDAMEHDESYVQIIPYLYAFDARRRLLWYRRKHEGEERLDGRISVGFGGHVNPNDVLPGEVSEWSERSAMLGDPSMQMIVGAALREWEEEVGPCRPRGGGPGLHLVLEGLIWMPDNPVGRVHLGVVFQAVGFRDVPLDLGVLVASGKAHGWETPQDLLFGPSADAHSPSWPDLERWSQLLVAHLSGDLVDVEGESGWVCFPGD